MSALESATLWPQFGELTAKAAQRWIAAALAQAAALHEHDAWLYPHDHARQHAAEQLHAAWRQWSDDADALLQKAEAIDSTNGQIPGLDDLRDAVGYAQAMLQLTPAEATRRRMRALSGDVRSIEEVRRELRSSHRR